MSEYLVWDRDEYEDDMSVPQPGDIWKEHDGDHCLILCKADYGYGWEVFAWYNATGFPGSPEYMDGPRREAHELAELVWRPDHESSDRERPEDDDEVEIGYVGRHRRAD